MFSEDCGFHENKNYAACHFTGREGMVSPLENKCFMGLRDVLCEYEKEYTIDEYEI